MFSAHLGKSLIDTEEGKQESLLALTYELYGKRIGI